MRLLGWEARSWARHTASIRVKTPAVPAVARPSAPLLWGHIWGHKPSKFLCKPLKSRVCEGAALSQKGHREGGLFDFEDDDVGIEPLVAAGELDIRLLSAYGPCGFIKRMRLTATVWGKGSQFAAAMARGVQIPVIAVPDQQKGQDA